MLWGYASLTRPRDHPQCAAAQSQRDHRRAAAVRPLGRHGTVGVRQELAGVRYPLRRGPTPLHRVALDVCQAVPRADAETAGRRDRGDLPRGRHRAEEPDDEQPLDRRDGHGDLRFLAALMGAHRHAALREVRQRCESRHRPGSGGCTGGRRGAACCAPTHSDDLPAPRERAPAGRRGGGAAPCGGVRAGPARRRPGPSRPADAVATAFNEGEGVAVALDNGDRRRFSAHPTCSNCGTAAPALTPILFSFNNPRGACPGCNGFGAVLEYDESLIVPQPRKSLAQGALDPWTKPRYEGRRRILRETGRAKGIPLDAPWEDLTDKARHFLLNGASGRFLGMLPFLQRLEAKRYKQYIRVFLRQYQLAKTCPACGVAALTAGALRDWIAALQLTPFQRAVAVHILAELAARVSFVNDVGLGYLTLDRLTRTLSGGEAQRIALSNALGSHLVDTLYVLDEPTIGLHPADTGRLLGLLRRLADGGNTVVVVEHDPAAMRAADWMVELGPASGEAGGELVYQGPAAGVRAAGTLTGQYLSGEKCIGVPSARRPARRWLEVKGARLHNLRDVDTRIPLGTLTAVTGVSGSGKSTLVHDVLFRQLESRLTGTHGAKQHLGEPVGEVRALDGWQAISDVVLVDQAPIGRTPRSNPITYIKAFDELRALFAAEPLARARAYTPSTFSFNVAGGRCDACEGAGHVLVEMVFLANVFVPCEVCAGKRFKKEVLDVKLGGSSIHDVLEWTVDQALRRFHRQPRLARAPPDARGKARARGTLSPRDEAAVHTAQRPDAVPGARPPRRRRPNGARD